MNIGHQIKQNRLKREWTQEYLAQLLNVSRSTVSSWEVGRNYPDLETIVAISDLFAISLDKLLREDSVMTKEVSKRMHMNKYYKIVLTMIAVILLGLVISNRRLNQLEQRYRENLTHYGWHLDKDTSPYANNSAYELKTEDTTYYTYILPTGYNPIPLEERKVNIITRRNGHVVDVLDSQHITVAFSKSNDAQLKYQGSGQVNLAGELIADQPRLTGAKKAYFKAYLKQHQKTYQALIQNSLQKKQEIITKR
ncbi:helix-turn-helix transcriptional regulator [Latilactobacillus sakei]|uniref:helix-turn-helix transcriptional regulator n=1 Tax=Latilactobacillus sakei TaxID=1599 RepID=UPI0020C7D88C|nr:helix-turn-helix transcriptional regulator [Latilactobacillus sakei]MCP8852608.1 helix-turn-helix domain-containing protein [Latilactobacillus sakei]